MGAARTNIPSMAMREMGDSLQGDALVQAGLFALLLSALSGAAAACYLVFWRPVLGVLIP